MIYDDLLLLLVTKENNSYEYQIAKYLIENRGNIINVPLKKVLDDTFVSKSTLFRFCRALGCQNYTELQNQLYFFCLRNRPVFKMAATYPLSEQVKQVLKGKKRVIVYGESIALGCLLHYKKIFLEKGVELYFKLIKKPWQIFIDEVDVNEEDVVIHLSLSYSFFELNVADFHTGTEMKDFLTKRNVPVIHIGRFTQFNKETSMYIDVSWDEDTPKALQTIGLVFDNIYNCL